MRDDAPQAAAADSFAEPGAWVSILALTETAWVLRALYGLKPLDIARAIEMLLGHKSLVLQDADAIALALDTDRAKPSLGFSDCLMRLSFARKSGNLPLGTFDRALAKLDGCQRL